VIDDHDIEQVDALIDDVAQTMTSAPAGDDFARRVSARIAEAGERRTSRVRPWVLVPVAAACVLLLAVVLVRMKPDATEAGRQGAPEDQTVRLRADPTRETTIDKTARVETARPQRNAPLPRIVPIGDALAPQVNPIEISALDVAPLVEMDFLEISPIAIDRIEISAMP
jgi:hypothetical protein